MRLDDVEMVPPAQGAAYNLPSNAGAILLKLLASIKSSRNKKVDVVIALQTVSGLRLGFWLSKLLSILHQLDWDSPSGYLFRTNANTPWTSHYFRTHHLYPLLHLQHLNGAVTLRHTNITSAQDIPHCFSPCTLIAVERTPTALAFGISA